MSEDSPRADHSPLASRYGLVRPLQGRYVAGVCAALGRATGTDPVLWRVLLGVLFCFFGVGALIYLVVWLFVPEEGDQSSPVEALLGRGSSSTSPILVAVLGLVAMGLLVLVIPRPLYLMLLGGTVLLAIALLNRARSRPAPPGGPAVADFPPGTGGPPPAPPAATAGSAGWEFPAPSAPPESGPVTVPPAPPEPGVADAVPGDAPPEDAAAAAPPPAPYSLSPDPVGGGSSGYRPAFAPHGPFAGPPAPPPPPPPPPAPRERSALPALTFFGMLLALGVLGALDFTGLLDVPAAGYVATALAMVGAGLVLATWLGRARSLIALGVVLTLALPAVHAADTWDRPEHIGGDFSWTPENTTELADEYALMFGSGRLDLRQVEFSGRQVDLAVEMTFGEFTVIVPPDVAVDTTVDNRFGSVNVLGRTLDGVTDQTVQDPGSGEPADGTLRLDLQNRFGEIRVNRSSGG